MPCREPDWATDQYISEAKRSAQKKIDQLTALLCEACHEIPREKMSKSLRAWWSKHRAADAKRIKEDQERRELKRLAARARSKLTTEELEALRHEIGR